MVKLSVQQVQLFHLFFKFQINPTGQWPSDYVYLKSKEKEDKMKLMTWLPQSPDLKPKELVCDELDRKVKVKQ